MKKKGTIRVRERKGEANAEQLGPVMGYGVGFKMAPKTVVTSHCLCD